MKFQIIWSEFAEQQIDEIFEYYVAKASVKIATKIIKGLLLKPECLIENPKLGAEEEALKIRAEKYRYLVSTNYKIIYSVDEKNKLIKITDIFDTRQNPLKLNRSK